MSDKHNQSIVKLFDEKGGISNRSGLFREYQSLDLHRLSGNIFSPISVYKEDLDLDTGHMIDPYLGANLSASINNLNNFIDRYGGLDSQCDFLD